MVGDWHGQLGKLVARDFAVLARMSRQRDDGSDALWDYYFAGIRGLGTWGASWFVDREYKKLQRFDRDDPIQMLLEVTYRDGRIFQARDVSNEPAEFFEEENRDTVIDRVIDEYRE